MIKDLRPSFNAGRINEPEAVEFRGVHASVRSVPTDVLFDSQWYLSNTGQTGGTAGIDLDITRVWDDYTGHGVAVGVFDDGIDYNNPDLNDNYDASRHITINGAVSDPAPANWGSYQTGGDTHGTAVAGVIAAESNGIGGVGVACNAKITGVAVLRAGTDADFIEGMQHQRDFDVVNHSWGFTTPFGADFGSGNPVWAAFADTLSDAAACGRGGLGTIVVKAGGNDRGSGFDVNYDNFDNDRHVISVGAVDQNGCVSWYSTPGAALLVCAPSSNTASEAGITTTDLSGASGDSAGDYRSDFGGTSAASPMVSGVVADMLEAHPGLGWRDVQEILAYSARHVGSDMEALPSNDEWYSWEFNGAHTWNGGGLHFSNDYGFGLVDARSAVRLAETWTFHSTSANEQVTTASQPFGAAIPDNDPAGVTKNFYVADNLQIDHVELSVDIAHTWRGDLAVTLISPEGTASTLVNRPLAGTDDTDDLVFNLSSVDFWGEASQGTWAINVSDGFVGDTGALNAITFRAYGDAFASDDAYIYTNEFSAFGGVDGRHVLSDSAGIDTLNAAAVSSDLAIDLQPGYTSTIAGRPLTIAANAWIENAQGGDGADSMIGNSLDNTLAGNRGDDVLNGGAGNDTLIGGAGNDTLNGGWGYDFFDGGPGRDTLDLTAGGSMDIDLARGDWRAIGGTQPVEGFTSIENVLSGSGNDRIAGDAVDNLLSGGTGDDCVTGGAGNDRIFGGAGNDLLNGGWGYDSFGGGPGNDTIDLTAGGSMDIDLARGDWRAIGGLQPLETLVGIENVLSGSGNDRIVGDSGPNALFGGAGTDLLSGGAGKDQLSGGLGNDTFVFGLASDSPLFSGRDVIKEWTGGDRIDLSAIDANVGSVGDQSFDFAGLRAADNSAGAGILKYYHSAENTYVVAGVDGNGVADLQIELLGVHTLSSADFIL